MLSLKHGITLSLIFTCQLARWATLDLISIAQCDWEPFLQLAQKVTRITVDSTIHNSGLELFKLHFPGPIFPKLQSIIVLKSYLPLWRPDTITLMVRPTVVKVDIRRCTDKQELVDIISTLAIKCPQIGILRLAKAPNLWPEPMPLMPFWSWRSLRTLHVGDMTLANWRMISKCPDLEEAFIVQRDLHGVEEWDTDLVTTFPRLRILRIESLRICEAVLYESEMPVLETLVAGPEVYIENGDLAELISTRSKVLRELDLRIWWVLDDETILPLANLKHL